MNSLVIYDSNFGNTQLIAEAIANKLQTTAVSINNIEPNMLKDLELLIVGSPINAWRPTPKIQEFLRLLGTGLVQVKAAAFDTRVNIFISGNASKKIAKALALAGADIVVPPEAFYVKTKGGPLAEGELERSKNWASQIISKIKIK